MTEWAGGTAGILDGVAWGRLDTHADERGAFRELWRASASPEHFVQANLSTSAARVLRGLHYHRRQLDRWTVARGRAFVALVDVRPLLADISAQTRLETRVLGPDEWVAIPAGVAHGFYALEPTDLLYFVTNEYDGTDELGFAWNDPAVGVPWPDPDPILSPRDRSNPSLRELVRSLGG
jgi:dTDP-4-dehydrorhamnose 3,5-epimerase